MSGTWLITPTAFKSRKNEKFTVYPNCSPQKKLNLVIWLHCLAAVVKEMCYFFNAHAKPLLSSLSLLFSWHSHCRRRHVFIRSQWQPCEGMLLLFVGLELQFKTSCLFAYRMTSQAQAKSPQVRKLILSC